MNTRNLRFRSNRVADILALYHAELDPLYGHAEVGTFCDMLFDEYLDWNKAHLMANRDRTIDQSDLLRFHHALDALNGHRPIQHIIGHTDFCGCRIRVSPDVLIPRPETAEMVRWVAAHASSHTRRCIDLCTGSGCIAIALKKALPQAHVAAIDISVPALAIARGNAQANGADIDFIRADILTAIPGTGPLDLIVSNPPYVLDSERATMQPNVLLHEPALALFVPDDDPLRFYRPVADLASARLSIGGLVAVEVNEAQADAVSALFAGRGLCPTLHRDFRDRPRWIAATRINHVR